MLETGESITKHTLGELAVDDNLVATPSAPALNPIERTPIQRLQYTTLLGQQFVREMAIENDPHFRLQQSKEGNPRTKLIDEKRRWF